MNIQALFMSKSAENCHVRRIEKLAPIYIDVYIYDFETVAIVFKMLKLILKRTLSHTIISHIYMYMCVRVSCGYL